MGTYRGQLQLVTWLLVIMGYHQVLPQDIRTYCRGRTVSEQCPTGKVHVYTEVLYGSRRGTRTCGATTFPIYGCKQQPTGSALNGLCFGENLCTWTVEESMFTSSCNDPNNYLQATRSCVRAEEASRLCEAVSTDRAVGHVFGSGNQDCTLDFNIPASHSLRLRLVYPPHVNTKIYLCGYNLYFTMRHYTVMDGRVCPQTSIDALTLRYGRFPTPLTLIAEREVLNTDNGLLLYYEELPTPAVTPVPIETNMTANTVLPFIPNTASTTTASTTAEAAATNNQDDESESAPLLTRTQTIIVVSLVCVVLVGIVLIIVLVVCLIRRRRKKQADDISDDVSDEGSHDTTPTREGPRPGNVYVEDEDDPTYADPTTLRAAPPEDVAISPRGDDTVDDGYMSATGGVVNVNIGPDLAVISAMAEGKTGSEVVPEPETGESDVPWKGRISEPREPSYVNKNFPTNIPNRD